MSQSTKNNEMEVDFDVPKYLSDERQKVPSHLQHYFTTFEDLYERKQVDASQCGARETLTLLSFA